MARVKRAVHARKHHRAVLEQAKGYYGNKSRTFRAANEQVMHSMQYAFRDRRARKGDFRKLWIQRINAAARGHGMSYSRLIAGLHRAGVEVDRKVLADLAVTRPRGVRRAGRHGPASLAGETGSTARNPSPPRPRRRRFLSGQPLASPAGPAAAPAPPQAQRAARERVFVVEGPSCSPRRSPPAPRSRPSTSPPRRATTRGAAEVLERARGAGPGLRPGPRGARAGGRHGDAPAAPGRGRDRRPPLGALARRATGRRVRRRARPGQPRHRDAHGGRRRGRRAWCAARDRRPVQPQDGAGLGRVALPRAGGRGGPAPVALGRARPRRATGASAPSARGGADYAASTGRPRSPWSSATRRPGSARSSGRRSTRSVTIPMAGRAESLNVGVAAAVLCFEALRQRLGLAVGGRLRWRHGPYEARRR